MRCICIFLLFKMTKIATLHFKMSAWQLWCSFLHIHIINFCSVPLTWQKKTRCPKLSFLKSVGIALNTIAKKIMQQRVFQKTRMVIEGNLWKYSVISFKITAFLNCDEIKESMILNHRQHHKSSHHHAATHRWKIEVRAVVDSAVCYCQK